MRNYAGTCKGIFSYNLVYNFLTQPLPLQSSVFVVHFSNAFWHGNKAFPKGSSQNEIVPLLVIFHLPYSKYRNVKICFYSCSYQNQNFFTRVALVSLVSGTRVVNQPRSFFLHLLIGLINCNKQWRAAKKTSARLRREITIKFSLHKIFTNVPPEEERLNFRQT